MNKGLVGGMPWRGVHMRGCWFQSCLVRMRLGRAPGIRKNYIKREVEERIPKGVRIEFSVRSL